MKKNIDNLLKHPIISGIVVSISLAFINLLMDKLKNKIPQVKNFLELDVKMSILIIIISLFLVIIFIFNLVYLKFYTKEFIVSKKEYEQKIIKLKDSIEHLEKENNTIKDRNHEIKSELNEKNNILNKIEISKNTPSFKQLSKFNKGDIVGIKIEDKLIGREKLQVIEIDEINIKIRCRSENGGVKTFIPEELYTSIEFNRIREEGKNGLHNMLFGN